MEFTEITEEELRSIQRNYKCADIDGKSGLYRIYTELKDDSVIVIFITGSAHGEYKKCTLPDYPTALMEVAEEVMDDIQSMGQ